MSSAALYGGKASIILFSVGYPRIRSALIVSFHRVAKQVYHVHINDTLEGDSMS